MSVGTPKQPCAASAELPRALWGTSRHTVEPTGDTTPSEQLGGVAAYRIAEHLAPTHDPRLEKSVVNTQASQSISVPDDVSRCIRSLKHKLEPDITFICLQPSKGVC